MNRNNLDSIFKLIKRLDLSKAHATFWIIKRSGIANAPKFSVFYVDTEPHLQKKLTEIVNRCVGQAKRVREYDYFTADVEDDDALVVGVDETPFEGIREQVGLGSNAPKITKPDELNDSWAYLIDVEIGGRHLQAVHKIIGGWAIKKQAMMVQVLFSKSTLVDYEDAAVFQLGRKLDFFVFEGIIFILDKSKFESALNFRVGMERKRDELLTDLGNLKLMNDLGLLGKTIGTNLHLLRRVASVKKNGYYKDAKFLSELKRVCAKYSWNVSWKDGQIIVTPENVEDILKLLNNDRLESPVNAEIFDVLAKVRVK